MDWARGSAKGPNALAVVGSEDSARQDDRPRIRRPDFNTITEAAAMQWLGIPVGDGPPVMIGTYHGPAILERLLGEGRSDPRPRSRRRA